MFLGAYANSLWNFLPQNLMTASGYRSLRAPRLRPLTGHCEADDLECSEGSGGSQEGGLHGLERLALCLYPSSLWNSLPHDLLMASDRGSLKYSQRPLLGQGAVPVSSHE